MAAHADMSIEIAPIREAHIEAFHAAWDQVAKEKLFLYTQAAPPLAEVAEFVRNNLRQGNPHLVALAGGELIGWCDIVRLTQATVKHRGALTVALLPAWRHQGIGRRLIQTAIPMAWEQGIKRIELVARGINTNAIALYRKLGFEQEGLRRKASFVEGRFYDLVDMAILHPDFME